MTGGSRGIGRAIALTLAREGAEILLHYHSNRKAAEDVAQSIGKPVRLLKANLRSPHEIDALADNLGDAQVDILINNAGVWGTTLLGGTTQEQLDAILNLNVQAVFLLTQALLPRFREGARIVNISSIAGGHSGLELRDGLQFLERGSECVRQAPHGSRRELRLFQLEVLVVNFG